MRLNARTVLALIAILAGLVVAGIAIFAPNSNDETVYGALEDTVSAGPIAPINPNSGNHVGIGLSSQSKTKPKKPDIFDRAYGDRGSHDVTVTIGTNGLGNYLIEWRDGKKERGRTSGFTRSRTLKGGFPLVLVGIQGSTQYRVTCTIKIDGLQKDSQHTDSGFGFKICSG